MSSDAEFDAMQSAYSALVGLEKEAQTRVLSYVTSRLGLSGSSVSTSGKLGEKVKDVTENTLHEFEEFGELFDAFDASTDVEKALVAAYWSARSVGEESFDSQSLNSMLKNLGHGVTNITRALGGLVDQKPALVIQTRKSGTSKQARKTYKITRSGILAVEEKVKNSN